MSGEYAIRLHSILLLDLRNELSLKELQKVVRATTRRKSQITPWGFISRLRRREIASAIGVRNTDDNQIRDTTVLHKELDRARRVAHVRVAVSHIEDRI